MTDRRPQLQIRLDPALRERLEDEARKRVISVTVLAGYLLEDALSRLVPLEEILRTRDPEPEHDTLELRTFGGERITVHTPLVGDILVGQLFWWEPFNPGARELVEVVAVVDSPGLTESVIHAKCHSEGSPRYGSVYINDESRFREACIRVPDHEALTFYSSGCRKLPPLPS